LGLEKIRLVPQFISVVSKGTVISLLANVKVEETAGLGLIEVMIDFVVALLVLGSQQSHIITRPRIAEVRMVRTVS